MKSPCKLLVVFLAALISAAQMLQLPVSANNNDRSPNALRDVTVIKQSSTALGKSSLCLSTNAGQITAMRDDITITAMAPSWDILMFSKKKNLGFKLPASLAERQALGLLGSRLSLSRGKASTIHDQSLGIDCKEIVMRPPANAASVPDAPIFQMREKHAMHAVTLKIAQPCQISPGLQHFINFVYNLDFYPGVPLEMKNLYENGVTEKSLKTESIEHTKQPDSFFAYPKPAKITSNRMAVMISPDVGATLEDLWAPEPAAKPQKSSTVSP